MKFKKFNIVYESVMKSIITEDWDRFHLTDIVKVTQAVTHNFKDEWEKAATGKAVLTELMTFDHKRANYHVPGKGKHQYSYNDDYDREMDSASNIINTCNTYWLTRANNSEGGSFARECYHIFQSYLTDNSRFGKVEYIAPEIGKVAWAIWKAMNARLKKTEVNLQKAADMNLDSMFKIGEKVTFTLHVKYLSVKRNEFGTSYHLKGTDEEKWPGVMLDVVAGTAMQKQKFDDFKNCPDTRNGFAIVSRATEGDVYSITAKVKSVFKEGMTVFFNYGTVNDILAYGTTKDEQEEAAQNELVQESLKIKAAMEAVSDGNEEAYKLAAGFIPDVKKCWYDSEALRNALSFYAIVDTLINDEKSEPKIKKAFEILKTVKPQMEAFVDKIEKAKAEFK